MLREAFLPAGEAWTACRSGHLSPELFGHGKTRGRWFIVVNVVRDSLSLSGRETSAWDTWRVAASDLGRPSDDALIELDTLARQPEADDGIKAVLVGLEGTGGVRKREQPGR